MHMSVAAATHPAIPVLPLCQLCCVAHRDLPLLCVVLHVTGLQPGATYHYKVADSSGATDGAAKLLHSLQSGKTHTFTLPKPATFPLKIGVLGGEAAAVACSLCGGMSLFR